MPQFTQLVYGALTRSHAVAIRASNSQFASHILLVCLQQMPVHAYAGYVQYVSSQYLQIACDQYGCRILEYMYKKVESYAEHAVCATLVSCLEEHVSVLAAHKFGNYLVQAALRNRFYHTSTAVQALQGRLMEVFAELARSKYGSNTCECLVQTSSYSFIVSLARFLASRGCVRELIADQFGNFIVQMLLQKLSEARGECECTQCCQVHHVFGEQEERSEELIEEDGQVRPLKQLCRQDVFRFFSGVVKGILKDVPNAHVQRCLGKYAEVADLQEVEETEFARLFFE